MLCLICNKKIYTRVFNMDNAFVVRGVSDDIDPVKLSYPINIYICEKCGLVQQHITDELLAINEVGYERNDLLGSAPGKGYETKQQQNIIATLYENIKPKKTLEIGCNEGFLIKWLATAYRSSKFYGIDPATGTFSEENLTLQKGWFPQNINCKDKFDFIYSINVLEHVPDPLVFLKNIQNVMSSDGVLLLRIPEVSKSLEYGDISMALHQHYSYFTLFSIQKALNSVGLYIHSIQSNGSLIWIVASQKEDFHNYITPEEIVMQSESFEIKFMQRIETIKSCFARNAQFGLYGASAVPTLLSFISEEEIHQRCIIFDGDLYKQNKYIKGSCLGPILPYREEFIEGKGLSAVMVLPLYYQQAIYDDIYTVSMNRIERIRLYEDMFNHQSGS